MPASEVRYGVAPNSNRWPQSKVRNMNRTPDTIEVESSALDATEQRSVDEYVYLLGRPPLKQFLDFVADQVVDGRSLDRRALIEEWTSANNYLRLVEENEEGW